MISTGLAAGAEAWLTARLGSQPAVVFFQASSMSDVTGIELADGRRVALKVRGASPHLDAAVAAQRLADAHGIRVPHVLAGPAPFDGQPGMAATAEEWLPVGTPEPPADAAHQYARLLAQLVHALEGADSVGMSAPPWLHYDHADDSRVWPPPASERWDPHRIEDDLPVGLVNAARRSRERILELVREARPRMVVGHTDLNGLNVRWLHDASGGGARPIVHDWDSVAYRPEAVLVGALAVDHVAMPEVGAIAPVEVCAEVIGAYQWIANIWFSQEEIQLAWATTAWLASYNAVFEFLHGAPGAVTAQLITDVDERLALAGA